MDVQPGATAEVEMTVTPDRTADAMGNKGVMVLATPFLLGLLENATIAAIQRAVPPGAGSVGTMVEIRHLAATPVGMKVRAKATLVETDGRRFVFRVEAHDEVEKVAEGKLVRYIVPDLAHFMSRAMKKTPKA